MSDPGRPRLRALTFLAPGIPLEFFELVTAHLARSLGCEVSLQVDGRISGPMQGDLDPFAQDLADVGFLCSPSYLYLRSKPRPSVELVRAAFVFADPRHDGRPVYFSDIVVRHGHLARGFGDLAGGVWGYNDECSLSGYYSVLQKLSEIGCNGGFFARRLRTGGHAASIEGILSGGIDAAAIDSTVLALRLRAQPELAGRLRVIESLGPFPIQPVVLRAALVPEWGARIAAALRALGRGPEGADGLARFGLVGCVEIDDAAYAAERCALRDLGVLPG